MKSIIVDQRTTTPSKIVCIGRNYMDHIKELGNNIPTEMLLFSKPNSAISTVLQSWHEEALHYEAEISFIVEQSRLVAVGFGLDLTKRHLQSGLKKKGLPWERAKAFNGSALFSEFVAIENEQQELSIELCINGNSKQSGNTSMMLYKPKDILAEIETFMTLNDGDIIMTGTPKGVGIVNKEDEFFGTISSKGQNLVQHRWIAQ